MTLQLQTKRSIPALGTFVEITWTATPASNHAISLAFDEIKRLEKILSYYNDQSEVSLFNKHGYTRCHELKMLLKISKWLFNQSKEIFNPINPANNKLDLGGIAKGFAVDRAAKILQTNNIDAIINAGGDIKIVNNFIAPVYIRDPFDFTKNIFLGNFTNIALASSCISNNSRQRGGKSMVYQKCNIVHASVIGKSCTLCDAITKIALTNHDIAKNLLQKINYKAIIIDKDGNQFVF